MNKVAVVTGAGSGVGRAVALALIKREWKVALIGRREEMLKQTIQLTGLSDADRWILCSCDIGNIEAVRQMAQQVFTKFGHVDVVVNAAGTNIPKRSLEALSLEDYHHMLGANLHGAYFCVQAFLPSMRERKSGTIVNVGSEAGVQASAKSGPSYVIAKFGLRGLTQSINAEERANGIRACSLLPGDINTPLLDKRPEPPPASAREKMLWPEDVAECALFAIQLPPRAVVEEILIRPR